MVECPDLPPEHLDRVPECLVLQLVVLQHEPVLGLGTRVPIARTDVLLLPAVGLLGGVLAAGSGGLELLQGAFVLDCGEG